jgi:ubiquinone/menaquinone biosynthesis C-methylase UbiE
MENSMMISRNSYKTKSQAYFDTSADAYDKSSDMGIRPVLLVSIFNRLDKFPKPMSILDVGCGTGELLYQISACMNSTLAGLDISSNMLAIARKKLKPSVDLREGDAENLPWQNHSFDLVLCTLSFHHYPQPGKALSEISRVLMPGGTLLIADITMPTPLRQITNLNLPLLSTGDCHFNSKAEILYRLKETGFEQFKSQQIDTTTF